MAAISTYFSLETNDRLFNMVIGERNNVVLDPNAEQNWRFTQVDRVGGEPIYNIQKMGEDLNLVVATHRYGGGELFNEPVVGPGVILAPPGQGEAERWKVVETRNRRSLLQSMAKTDLYLVGTLAGEMAVEVKKIEDINNLDLARWHIWNESPMTPRPRYISLGAEGPRNMVVNGADNVVLELNTSQGWRFEQVGLGRPNEYRILRIGQGPNPALSFSWGQNGVTLVKRDLRKVAQRWKMVPAPDGRFLLQSVVNTQLHLVGTPAGEMGVQVKKLEDIIDHDLARWHILMELPMAAIPTYFWLETNVLLNMVTNEGSVVLTCNETEGWNLEQVGMDNGARVYRIQKNGEDSVVSIAQARAAGVTIDVALVPPGEGNAQRWKVIPSDSKFLIQNMEDRELYLVGTKTSSDSPWPSGPIRARVMRIPDSRNIPDNVRAKWHILAEPWMAGERRVSLSPDSRPFNIVVDPAGSVILDRNAPQDWSFEEESIVDGMKVCRIRKNREDRVLGFPQEVPVGGADVTLVRPTGEAAQHWMMFETAHGQFLLKSLADPHLFLVGTRTGSDSVTPRPPGPMSVRVMRITDINNIPGHIRAKWNDVNGPQIEDLPQVPGPFIMVSGAGPAVFADRGAIENCILEQEKVNEARVYRIWFKGWEMLQQTVTLDSTGPQAVGDRSKVTLSSPSGPGLEPGPQHWKIVPFEGKFLLQSAVDPQRYLASRYLPEAARHRMEVVAMEIPSIHNPNLVRAKWDISAPFPLSLPPPPPASPPAPPIALAVVVAAAKAAELAAVTAQTEVDAVEELEGTMDAVTVGATATLQTARVAERAADEADKVAAVAQRAAVARDVARDALLAVAAAVEVLQGPAPGVMSAVAAVVTATELAWNAARAAAAAPAAEAVLTAAHLAQNVARDAVPAVPAVVAAAEQALDAACAALSAIAADSAVTAAELFHNAANDAVPAIPAVVTAAKVSVSAARAAAVPGVADAVVTAADRTLHAAMRAVSTVAAAVEELDSSAAEVKSAKNAADAAVTNAEVALNAAWAAVAACTADAAAKAAEMSLNAARNAVPAVPAVVTAAEMAHEAAWAPLVPVTAADAADAAANAAERARDAADYAVAAVAAAVAMLDDPAEAEDATAAVAAVVTAAEEALNAASDAVPAIAVAINRALNAARAAVGVAVDE